MNNDMDYHALSVDLLQRIANSVYERDSKHPNLLFFSGDEVGVVESWLKDFRELVEALPK